MHAASNRAFLPGSSGIWEGEWISLASAPVTADDVGAWPYSVGILVKWVTFLGRYAGLRLGQPWGWRCSFVEVLILYDFGLERGLSQRRPFPGIGGLDAQFQC